MAQAASSPRNQGKAIPYWSQILRALRDARGITQAGWAAQLGYSRATVRRWESGQVVPSADAEREIIALCRNKRLFREFHEGPLLGVHVTAEWIADMLAMARLQPETVPASLGESHQPLVIPQVQYAANDDVSLAYQVFGTGEHTFVITPGTISHRELDWENAGMRTFLLHLAQSGRVIVYDKRSTGLSDRVAEGSIEDRINDLRAVMDAAKCEQAILVGFTEGGPISIKFAVTWPERVKALVLYGTSAKVPDISPETDPVSFDRLQQVWGTTESGFLEKFAPSVNFNQQEQEWWARFQRMGASPGAVRDLNAMNATLDVLSLLPEIQVPTLVVHRKGDLVTPFQEAVEMSEVIPDARLVALEGGDHLAWAGDAREISGAILDFATTLQSPPVTPTVLKTMVSFRCEPEHEDGLWERIRRLPSYPANSERRVTDNTALLTFGSPTEAMRCVREILPDIQGSGIDVGIGIHVGEVARNRRVIEGGAVRTCMLLAEQAPTGGVLVSDIVVRLISDAAFSFHQTPLPSRPGVLNGLEAFLLRAEG